MFSFLVELWSWNKSQIIALFTWMVETLYIGLCSSYFRETRDQEEQSTQTRKTIQFSHHHQFKKWERKTKKKTLAIFVTIIVIVRTKSSSSSSLFLTHFYLGFRSQTLSFKNQIVIYFEWERNQHLYHHLWISHSKETRVRSLWPKPSPWETYLPYYLFYCFSILILQFSLINFVTYIVLLKNHPLIYLTCVFQITYFQELFSLHICCKA